VTVGMLLNGAFRIVRERGGAMLIWTVVQLIALVAADFATAALMQNNIEAMFAGAEPIDAQMAYLLQTVPVFLAGLAVSTVLYAAAQRVVIHPTEGGPGWLKLGMDEVRLFVLTLLFLFVFVAGFLILSLFLNVLVTTAGAGEGAGAVQLVLVILGVVACAWLGTRFSLTFPLTLKQKAFALDDGWRLTRGHFWTLFATFLIIALILFAAGLATVLLTEADYIAAVSQYGLGSAEAELASMRHFQMLTQGEVDASIIVKWVLGAIQGAIGYALIGGAAATAVQQLTTDEERLSETFS
jgi:hypothetical protein